MNTTTSLFAAASVLCFSALVACTQTASTDATPAPGDDQAAAADDSTPPDAPAADAGKSDASKDSGTSKSDAGSTTPPPPPPPACSFVGTWDGTGPSNGTCSFPGMWLHWTAQVNGYADQSWQDGVSISETYSFGAGGSLIFNSSAGDLACGNATAQYKVTFDASCNTITLAKVGDSCADRVSCLDGMALTRMP